MASKKKAKRKKKARAGAAKPDPYVSYYTSGDLTFLESRRFTPDQIAKVYRISLPDSINLHCVTDSDTFRKKGRG